MARIAKKYSEAANSVVFLWENPCNLTWVQYAQLAAPAAGRAVLTLLEFDLCDILRCIFRPAALPMGSKRRPGRRGKGRIPSPLGIPEYLCERYLNNPNIRNRPVADGVRFLWAIDGAIQRLLFWWMIADVTAEFFINWSTLIQSSEACRLKFGGSAFGRAAPGPAQAGGLWRNVAFDERQQQGTVAWIGATGVSAIGTTVTATGAVLCDYSALSSPEMVYQTRITRDNIPVSTSPEHSPDPLHPENGIVHHPVTVTEGTWAIQLRVVDGIFQPADLIDAVFTVTTGGLPPYEIPNLNDFLCGVPNWFQ